MAGFLALALCVGRKWGAESFRRAEPIREKAYRSLIAEGVQYRDWKLYGNDRISFARCHVEKRRGGPVTFGAFNVLVIEDLVVNLPDPDAGDGHGKDVGGSGRQDIGGALADITGWTRAKVSGVRIKGFRINRVKGNGLVPYLTAESAESPFGGRDLRLRNCFRHSPGGGVVRLDDARMLFRPDFCVTHRDAEGALQSLSL